MNKQSSPYIHSKLKGLAHELFNLECARQNLLFMLDKLDEQLQALEGEVRFYYPIWEDAIIDLDNLVMYISPMECSVFTQDQFEKIEGTIVNEPV